MGYLQGWIRLLQRFISFSCRNMDNSSSEINFKQSSHWTRNSLSSKFEVAIIVKPSRFFNARLCETARQILGRKLSSHSNGSSPVLVMNCPSFFLSKFMLILRFECNLLFKISINFPDWTVAEQNLSVISTN